MSTDWLNRRRGEGFEALLCGMAMLVGAMAFTAQAEVSDMVIDVPAGTTMTSNEVISGEVRLVKTGLGKLILSAANTYSGGTALQAGIIEVQDKDALGTGEVSINGSTTQTNQLCFKIGGSAEADYTVPNAFTIETASSLEYPVFHFADKTWFSGTIHAKANLYLSTAWNKSKLSVGARYVKFLNTITADAGACIGGAPHCVITFNGPLITPLLDCCYAPDGMASNGGNEGRFLLNSKANQIDRIRIDQTTVYCYTKNACTNATLEWTDQHLADDVGIFDMCNAQSVFDIITPEIEKGGQGCVITNSTTTACTLTVYKLPTARDCYARLDGSLGFALAKGYDGKEITFKNRCHSMNGKISVTTGSITIGDGAAFPNATTLENSSSKRITVTSEEENVLDGVTTIAIGSTTYTFSEAAVKSLSKGCRALLKRTTGTLVLNGSTPLLVNRYYCSSENKSFMYPAGEYTKFTTPTAFAFTNGTAKGSLTGTVLSWYDNSSGARTGWTNMVWTGASAASHNVNDLANYEELPQYATFKVPIAWLKFGAVTGYAELTNDVYWGGITFGAASTGFTLKSAANDPTIHLYDNGLNFEAKSGEAVRTFTIEPTLDLQCAVPSVPEGDTLVLSGGVTTNNLVIPAENAGTIVLGGTVPQNNTVNGGTLAFADGATLPADDTMVLDLGESAKVKVDSGKVLRVKSVTTNGVAVSVGYFSDGFVMGGGKVRVNESSADPVPETITWKGEGDSGAFSAAANWDPEGVELGWANKYTTIFAKDGEATTGAVVDGAYSLIGMQFANTLGNFTFKQGGDSSSLAIGAGGIDIAAGQDETLARTFAFEMPVTMSAAWTSSVPASNTLVFANGLAMSNRLTLNGAGTIELRGDSVLDGVVTNNLGDIVVNGSISGSNNLFLKTAETVSRRLWLNNATVNKKIYLGTESASGDFYIRSSAPVGSSSYIKTFGVTGTTDAYFERGRTFCINTFIAVGKQRFGVCGSDSDGVATLVITNYSQSYRSSNGYLTINNNVDLSIGQTGELKARQLNMSGANSVLRFLDDYLVPESSATASDKAMFSLTAGNLYLGSTHQRCSLVNGSTLTTVIHGGWGSTFEIRRGATGGATFGGNFADSVSIVMNGSLTNWLCGVSTTDGELTVMNGTLGLTSAAKLPNLRAVNVSGGVLAISAADPFGGSKTALAVTGGTIDLASGCTLGCESATVNGEKVANGTCTAANPGAFAGYLTGAGKIRIGDSGTTFTVK